MKTSKNVGLGGPWYIYTCFRKSFHNFKKIHLAYMFIFSEPKEVIVGYYQSESMYDPTKSDSMTNGVCMYK